MTAAERLPFEEHSERPINTDSYLRSVESSNDGATEQVWPEQNIITKEQIDDRRYELLDYDRGRARFETLEEFFRHRAEIANDNMWNWYTFRAYNELLAERKPHVMDEMREIELKQRWQANIAQLFEEGHMGKLGYCQDKGSEYLWGNDVVWEAAKRLRASGGVREDEIMVLLGEYSAGTMQRRFAQ